MNHHHVFTAKTKGKGHRIYPNRTLYMEYESLKFPSIIKVWMRPAAVNILVYYLVFTPADKPDVPALPVWRSWELWEAREQIQHVQLCLWSRIWGCSEWMQMFPNFSPREISRYGSALLYVTTELHIIISRNTLQRSEEAGIHAFHKRRPQEIQHL